MKLITIILDVEISILFYQNLVLTSININSEILKVNTFKFNSWRSGM